MSRRPSAWLSAAVSRSGSTRSAGLLRVALATLAMALYGGELQLFRTLDGVSLGLGLLTQVASVCMWLGLAARASTAATGLCLVAAHFHFGVGLGRGAFLQHQSWLLATTVLLLSLTPCGGSYSVDRALLVARAARRGHAAPEERGDVWALRLVALQLSAVYLYGALQKTSAAFLGGSRLQQIFLELYWGSDRPQGRWFAAAAMGLALAVTGLEYALAVGLWTRRGRGPLLALGLAMHAGFHYLLPVGIFSALCAALYLAFLPPERVHGWLEAVHGAPPGAGREAAAGAQETAPRGASRVSSARA